MFARIHTQVCSVYVCLTVRFCLLISFCLLTISATSAFSLAADQLPLKYKWDKGQQYAYRVKIEVNMENYEETLSGVEIYDVTAADDNSFSLRCSGNLNSVTKSKSQIGRAHV